MAVNRIPKYIIEFLTLRCEWADRPRRQNGGNQPVATVIESPEQTRFSDQTARIRVADPVLKVVERYVPEKYQH